MASRRIPAILAAGLLALCGCTATQPKDIRFLQPDVHGPYHVELPKAVAEDLPDPMASGYLGVVVAPPSELLRERIPLLKTAGVVVREVLPDTPASRADIRKDDVIMKLNGERVAGPDDLQRFVRSIRPGQITAIDALREGKSITVPVTVGAKDLEPWEIRCRNIVEQTRIGFFFKDTPLSEALEQVEALIPGIEIMEPHFDDVLEPPVTLRVNKMIAENAFNWIATLTGTKWFYYREAVVFGGRRGHWFESVPYEVSDILAESPELTPEKIIEFLHRNVGAGSYMLSPDSDEPPPGRGVSVFGKKLVVHAMDYDQPEIKALLDSLRKQTEGYDEL